MLTLENWAKPLNCRGGGDLGFLKRALNLCFDLSNGGKTILPVFCPQTNFELFHMQMLSSLKTLFLYKKALVNIVYTTYLGGQVKNKSFIFIYNACYLHCLVLHAIHIAQDKDKVPHCQICNPNSSIVLSNSMTKSALFKL